MNQCCIDSSSRLLNTWRERIHKKIEANKIGLNAPSIQHELEYWRGFNAGLEWTHRIVNGDKSAD